MKSDSGMTSVRAISQRRSDDPERHFLIYCDESGVDGRHLVGFGSLWMTYERRGDFQQIWRDLHTAHFPPSEVKWHKVKAKTLPFFEAVIDEFFQRNWLMFHCLLISKHEVDLSFHENDWDLACRKHFTNLLANKIKRFAAPGKHYRIRVDPIHSRYAKADEAAEIILQNIMENAPSLKGQHVIESVVTVDSKQSPGVQLADLLVGAVMAARRGEATSSPKIAIQRQIAKHLGWSDLNADTMPHSKKFNIWRFWDPTSGKPRPEITRRQTITP
jgi:Protein of unknown function (DUF3800)